MIPSPHGFLIRAPATPEGEALIGMLQAHLNRDSYALKVVPSGPRRGLGNTTLRADATSLRVYVVVKAGGPGGRPQMLTPRPVAELEAIRDQLDEQLVSAMATGERRRGPLARALTWLASHT